MTIENCGTKSGRRGETVNWLPMQLPPPSSGGLRSHHAALLSLYSSGGIILLLLLLSQEDSCSCSHNVALLRRTSALTVHPFPGGLLLLPPAPALTMQHCYHHTPHKDSCSSLLLSLCSTVIHCSSSCSVVALTMQRCCASPEICHN